MSEKYNIELEFSILKTVCSSDLPDVRAYLLPRLTPLHFSSATAQNLYRRISTLLKKEQYIPTWRDLAYDPAVRKETRKAMRQVDATKLKTEEAIRSAYANLDVYRKIRALYQLGANLEEALEESSVNLDTIMSNLTKDLQIVIDGSQETPIFNIGVDDNSVDVVKTLLTTGGPQRIRTGFKAYDDKNLGFPIGAFVLLGADTGGGKSTMATVIADNMAMLSGATVGVIPLEMNAPENIQRNLARISGESLTNLIDPLNKISPQRRKEIYRAYKEYVRRLAAKNGKIVVIEPKFDATMENTLEFVKPLGLDVLIIDYVGLLSGLSEEDQWRAMSKATAYAKRWAEVNQCVVIGLVQISQEGMIRYSQAMKEHASYAWFWVNDDRAKETGVIEIKQAKSRQGESFNFLLKRDFATMTIRDLTPAELEEYLASTRPGSDNSGEAGWKKKKKKKREDEDEADDDEEVKPRKRTKENTKIKKPSRFEY